MILLIYKILSPLVPMPRVKHSTILLLIILNYSLCFVTPITFFCN